MDQSLRLDLFPMACLIQVACLTMFHEDSFLAGYGVIHMCFHNLCQIFAVNRSISFSKPSLQTECWTATFGSRLYLSFSGLITLWLKAKSKTENINLHYWFSSRWQVMAMVPLVQDLHLGICNASMTWQHDLGLCQHIQPAEQPIEPYPVALHPTALCRHSHSHLRYSPSRDMQYTPCVCGALCIPDQQIKIKALEPIGKK